MPYGKAISREGLADRVEALLSEIQLAIYEKAKMFQQQHITEVDSYDEFKQILEGEEGYERSMRGGASWRGGGLYSRVGLDRSTVCLRVRKAIAPPERTLQRRFFRSQNSGW